MKLKILFKTFLLTAAILSGALYLSVYSKETNKVTIKGSTTVLPITQKAIEAYPDAKSGKVAFSLDGSGSGNGIKALLDGNCDIANSSREIKKEELATAKKTNMKVKEIPIARDMIVPIVHPENPITNLSMNQLKAIYDGSIKNWKELDGKTDMKIVVVTRESSSGTYEFWHDDVMKKTDIRNDALQQASNGAVVSTVANNKKSIGYIGLGYLNKSVKGLKVNDIIPNVQNAKTKKYPITRLLYMYVNLNNYSMNAKKFVDFLLGKQGQDLVKAAGYLPL
jgi:phosphate transport system substrate-binding protein